MLKKELCLILLAISILLLPACGEEKATQDADTVVTHDSDTIVTCERDGITYQVGDIRQEDCNSCICQKEGIFTCTKILCNDDDLLSDGEEVNDDDAVAANIPFESYFGEGYDNSSPEKMAKFVTVDELFSYQPAFDQVSKEKLADYYIFYTSPAGRIAMEGCYNAWVETLNFNANKNILDITIAVVPMTQCSCNSTFSVPYLIILMSKEMFSSLPDFLYQEKEYAGDCVKK